MKFTPGIILLIVAVVLFLLAAFGVTLGGVDLITLLLAAFAGAFLRSADVASHHAGVTLIAQYLRSVPLGNAFEVLRPSRKFRAV